MENMILTLHIVICVILVILVLLQSGKEGMGVIFGGGSSSLFGGTGAGGILVKLTTFVAIAFFATSLGYNVLTTAKTTKESSIMRIVDDPSAPAAPETSTAPAANATTQQEPAAAHSTRTTEASGNTAATPETVTPQEGDAAIDPVTPEAPVEN